MPCSCDGFEFERTYFGKTYRGVTGGFTGSGRIIPEKFDWEAVIHDGEKALCRAQSVVRDLYALGGASPDLKERARAEIKALEEHKAAEAKKDCDAR